MNIVRTIKAGQPTLIHTDTSFVDEYADSVYKFCRSLTYSKEDAEDLFQETFLHAIVNLPKINDSGNPQSFLFSTALFIWKSWKRNYARRKRLALVEPLDETVAGDDDIESDFLEQEEFRHVREIVKSLPDKYRITIILYYIVEQSVSDIAATLRLPVGTVKSRLFKARKLIEKGLDDNEKR